MPPLLTRDRQLEIAINRLKVGEIGPILYTKVNVLRDRGVNAKAITEGRANKRDKIGTLVEECKRLKIVDKVLNDVELCNVNRGFGSRKWFGYVMDRPVGIKDPDLFDPSVIQRRMDGELKWSFQKQVSVMLFHDRKVWLRMSLAPIASTDRPSIIYGLYSPHGKGIALTNIPAKFKDSIEAALMKAFYYTELTKVPRLEDKSAMGVLNMALEKARGHQPIIATEQTGLLGPDEDVQRQQRKRKVGEVDLNDNVIDANGVESAKRLKFAEELWGGQPLPQLKQLTFKVNTKFQGGLKLDDEDLQKNFAWSAVFRGNNVLEGFRELIRKGIMDYPISTFMNNLPQMGGNTFSVRDHTDRKKPALDLTGFSTSSEF